MGFSGHLRIVCVVFSLPDKPHLQFPKYQTFQGLRMLKKFQLEYFVQNNSVTTQESGYFVTPQFISNQVSSNWICSWRSLLRMVNTPNRTLAFRNLFVSFHSVDSFIFINFLNSHSSGMNSSPEPRNSVGHTNDLCAPFLSIL